MCSIRKIITLLPNSLTLDRNLTLAARTLWPLERSLFRSSSGSAAPAVVDPPPRPKETHEFPLERIRNFSIIAHVDHGKSTLADRILESVGAIKKPTQGKNEQVLDKLQVERERGITVKSQTVSFRYQHEGLTYQINLIDTPGHADFNYEVSRSLAACQGCILLVDANSGIQAQTMNNFFLAFERELAIIPVMNKIDLPQARPDAIADQLVSVFDVQRDEIIRISAKLGQGIDAVMAAIVERIPPPTGRVDDPLRALIFDSWFKQYRGVVALVTLTDGKLRAGDKIHCHHTGKSHTVQQVGVFTPDDKMVDQLHAGQVGYIMSGMKETTDAMVGDTIYLHDNPVEPFEGFQKMKPVVFAGFFPVDPSNPAQFEKCIRALTLNDPSVEITRDTGNLGSGYRLGFLGFLHLDVFRLRLVQEFENAGAIVTAPSVVYKVKLKKSNSVEEEIHDPQQMPSFFDCEYQMEPLVMATLLMPREFEKGVRALCEERRGEEVEIADVDETRLMVKYRLPLNEVVMDFHERLKSVSSGFASLEYEDDGYRPTHVVKLEFTVNHHLVEELTTMVHNERARDIGKYIVYRLKRVIEPQPFKIVIRAQVGETVICRDNKSPLKGTFKSMASMTEKNKAKKAANKKKRMAGDIVIPPDAFIEVLRG